MSEEKNSESMAITSDNSMNRNVNNEAVVKDDLEEMATSASRPLTTKKSGFKITSVTKKNFSATNSNTDGDGDSIDDILDESHTEDVNSELYDSSKMTDCDHDSIPEDTLHNLTPDDTVKEKVSDAGGPSRFKVVKIETKEPFKRGRWICHDFLDPTTADKDKSEMIKTVEEPHSGNSSGSNSVNYVQGIDDPMKNPLIANYQAPSQVVSNLPNQQIDSSVKNHLVSPNVGALHSVINTTTDFQPIKSSSQKPTPSQISGVLPVTTAQTSMWMDTPPLIGHGSTTPTSHVPVSISQSVSSQIPQTSVLPNSTVSSNVVLQQQPSSSLASIQATNQQRNAAMSHSVPNTSMKTAPQQPVSNAAVVPPSLNAMQSNTQSYKAQIPPSPINEHAGVMNPPLQQPVSSNPVQSNASDQITAATPLSRKISATSTIPVSVSDSNFETVPSVISVNPAAGSVNTAVKTTGDVSVNHCDVSDIGNGDAVRLDLKKVTDKIDVSLSAPETGPQELRSTQIGVPGSLAEAVGGLAAVRDDKDDSGASTVTIDNRIEQAMDLVKSHLKFAVREEVEVLREQIVDLVKKNSQLEQENNILKAGASQETLAKLNNQIRPPAPSSTS